MPGLYIDHMSQKKPFVLRLDPEKLKAIERWAADEFRSTNGQIEYIIDQALRKSGRWKTRPTGKQEEPEKTEKPDKPENKS
jgi:hypothetical protein